MRRGLLLSFLVLFLGFACSAGQIFENDSELPADGIHIQFATPVTITAPDPFFPHYHPSATSSSFWFFGWKLLPGKEIEIDWAPTAVEVTGFSWLAWEAASSLDTPGLIDDFEDGNLISEVGATWTAITYGGEDKANLLYVDAEHDDAYLATTAARIGTISADLNFSPLDVTEYEGLYLRMSASVLAEVSVELMARDPTCKSGYRFVTAGEPAAVSDETAEWHFPFASFVTEPDACPSIATNILTERLIHIAIFVSAADAGTLQIYEIGFYAPENP